jgi:hypothetical protein
MFARLALLLFALSGAAAHAQFATPTLPFVQLGLKGAPGVGAQGAFVTPAAAVFTQEGALYLDYLPEFEGVDGLLVGLGVGASVRVLRALTVLADYDAGRYDLDVGFRFGPSFFFSFTERAAASKARSFRLFTEPFLRGSVRLDRRSGARVVYVEVGTRPSHLRAGLLLGL